MTSKLQSWPAGIPVDIPQQRALRNQWVPSSSRFFRQLVASVVSLAAHGELGTEIGDYCSHNLKLDDGGAAILLSPIVLLLFVLGRGGRLLLLPVYWTIVVMIRAAGTAVGDYLSSRHMLGLPLSTTVTGIVFVALLIVWKQASQPDKSQVGETVSEQA